MVHGSKVKKMTEVYIKASKAKEASLAMALVSTETKNAFLQSLANLLRENSELILDENEKDILLNQDRLSSSLIDRLRLNESRIEAMAKGCEDIIQLIDPNGSVIEQFIRPNGLEIQKIRVPLGVIAMIYEARPNVTIDAAALCLKAGNSVILRGGKEAFNSNKILVGIIKQALIKQEISPESVQFIENNDRTLALELMQDREHIDVLIPRGSAKLIQSVIENARVPILETGVGNCHIYVEASADLRKALAIVINAKCSRPGVCNAAEKCLVDQSIAKSFLELLIPALLDAKVEIRACSKTKALFPELNLASSEDWDTEYLDLILGIKIVDGLQEAISHIQKHGTKHSESIVTNDNTAAQQFQKEVDAAAVYVNASTRFTDGSEFGYGAEIGISTQKLHTRGPMGLNELCTIKYLIHGDGQTR